MKTIVTMAICLAIPAGIASAQSPEQPKSAAECPLHDAHMHEAQMQAEAQSAMNERGDKGMGFSQTATTHHFLMKADGGVIQIEVKDGADTADRDNIRKHLAHIAQAFSNGDFEIPMFVHDTVPPGVAEMKLRKAKIHYAYEETPTGGRVVIATSDKEALAAIHKFLRFQIEEHKTGDAQAVR
ncbi:MAG TPA: hypothetical protein VGI16_12330 [Candidatus Acidoferrum sp.]|jgi:hypothetical protein